MEGAMRACVIAIAVLLTSAGPAFSQPAKSDAAKPAQPEPRPVNVFLASAEPVSTPAPETAQPSPAPKRRIAPRVTTCRCGDPQAEPDTPKQQ
jgi:hypothetical protein